MTTSIITRGSGVSIAGRQARGVSPAFSRASTAYQSDGRLVGVGVPRFETVDGRRGVLVEEGTTNCWANPAERRVGYEWTYAASQTMKAGETWTLSFDAKRADNSDNSIRVAMGTNIYIPLEKVTNEYQRFSQTVTFSADATTVYLLTNSGSFWFRNPQLEKKPYATSFADSTRLGECLTILENPMTPKGGSIESWARANVRTGTYQPPFDGRWSPTLPVGLLVTGLVVACFYTDPQGASSSFDTGLRVNDITAWNHYTVTYDGASIVPYLNGVSGVPKTAVIGTNRSDPLRMGVTAGGAFFNGLLSSLSIHKRCLTSSEVAAHMAGDIPNDCYHYPFDGDLWPAPGSLGAVAAPSIITRPGSLEVIRR